FEIDDNNHLKLKDDPFVYAGTYNVTITVTGDVFGTDNSRSYEIVVTGKSQDVTDPVITIIGANPLNHEAATTYSDPGATCSDVVDGTLTVRSTSNVNASAIGDYTVSYGVITYCRGVY
ncbi:immunoglobulin-like domain-containing protein, partial [Vibrio parahaemolyticus]|uniref:immunoglobulin-like domain-containing protein n=1 Tax=Vibrio parahaemolyticus TaxID=670 RepID=UPI0013779F50